MHIKFHNTRSPQLSPFLVQKAVCRADAFSLDQGLLLRLRPETVASPPSKEGGKIGCRSFQFGWLSPTLGDHVWLFPIPKGRVSEHCVPAPLSPHRYAHT